MAHPSIAAKRREFKILHETGCFILPNPWDIGSTVYLQSLGFKALATTSSGFAWSQGRPDNALPRARVLAHLAELVAATELPVNADFENGFGTDAATVAESVRLAVATGVAGLSIEDSTGDRAMPLFPIDAAVTRLKAARRAIDANGGDTLLVGRAEGMLAPPRDLDDTLARLKAYADAGADCLYAPGAHTVDEVTAIVAAVHPKPVNLLIGAPGKLTLREIAALGVRRVSVGGALARSAWGSFMRAARLLAEDSFEGFADIPGHGVVNAVFNSGGPSDRR